MSDAREKKALTLAQAKRIKKAYQYLHCLNKTEERRLVSNLKNITTDFKLLHNQHNVDKTLFIRKRRASFNKSREAENKLNNLGHKEFILEPVIESPPRHYLKDAQAIDVVLQANSQKIKLKSFQRPTLPRIKISRASARDSDVQSDPGIKTANIFITGTKSSLSWEGDLESERADSTITPSIEKLNLNSRSSSSVPHLPQADSPFSIDIPSPDRLSVFNRPSGPLLGIQTPRGEARLRFETPPPKPFVADDNNNYVNENGELSIAVPSLLTATENRSQISDLGPPSPSPILLTPSPGPASPLRNGSANVSPALSPILPLKTASGKANPALTPLQKKPVHSSPMLSRVTVSYIESQPPRFHVPPFRRNLGPVTVKSMQHNVGLAPHPAANKGHFHHPKPRINSASTHASIQSKSSRFTYDDANDTSRKGANEIEYPAYLALTIEEKKQHRLLKKQVEVDKMKKVHAKNQQKCKHMLKQWLDQTSDLTTTKTSKRKSSKHNYLFA